MESKLDRFNKRAHAQHALRTLYDEAGGRELKGWELEEETRIGEDIKMHDRVLKRLIEEEEQDKAYAKSPLFGIGNTGETRTATTKWAGYGQRVIDSINTGSMNAAVELPLEQRDDIMLTAGTATDGAEAVPVRTHDSVWSFLTEASPIMQLASVIRTDDGAALKVPTAASFSAPALIVEGAEILRNAPQFAAVTLDAYKYGNRVEVSNELSSDNSADVMGFVIQQGTTALGNAVDTALVSGTGTAQPNGIDNCTVGQTIASASAITMDEIIDVMHDVGPQYRPNGSWLINDATLLLVRKLLVNAEVGHYAWQPSTILGQPDTLLGHPIYSEPNIAALDGTVNAIVGVFGDIERAYLVRVAGGLRIERSADYAFANDAITIRFLIRVDGDIVDAAAVRSIKAAAA